jgi:hypothetical protein
MLANMFSNSDETTRKDIEKRKIENIKKTFTFSILISDLIFVLYFRPKTRAKKKKLNSIKTKIKTLNKLDELTTDIILLELSPGCNKEYIIPYTDESIRTKID